MVGWSVSLTHELKRLAFHGRYEQQAVHPKIDPVANKTHFPTYQTKSISNNTSNQKSLQDAAQKDNDKIA
jgi:hypothetical protein